MLQDFPCTWQFKAISQSGVLLVLDKVAFQVVLILASPRALCTKAYNLLEEIHFFKVLEICMCIAHLVFFFFGFVDLTIYRRRT